MEETGAKLILDLAELLGAKQVETDVIDRALAMISSEFAFDGAGNLCPAGAGTGQYCR